MRSLAILLWVLLFAGIAAQDAAADQDYAAPGSFRVRQVDETWTDGVRRRGVPVRIRLPQGSEPVPVIVFSHGLGGSVDGGREWGEHWASHGFAVVHVQHPGSDESLWRDKPPGERLAGLRSGADLQQFLARIADIKFVVAELDRRQARGNANVARLDLRRLGMSGHSFGAVTTLYLGGQRPGVRVADQLASGLAEPRFAAFLAFSPQASAGEAGPQFAGFTRPALLITGSFDGQPFPGLGASAAQRLVPFEAMPATGDKYMLMIDQADHMFFNGTRGLRDIGAGGRDGVDFAAVEARGYRLIKAVSTAYWLAYLSADRKAARWLKEGDAARAAGSAGYLKLK